MAFTLLFLTPNLGTYCRTELFGGSQNKMNGIYFQIPSVEVLKSDISFSKMSIKVG